MEEPPARLLSPAEKKAKAEQAERWLRSIKAQAANAVEEHVKDIRTREHDTWAELEAKFQAADAKVQSTEEEAQSVRMEAEAKIQSADKAVEEAKEYRLLCHIQLYARKEFGSEAIRQAEKNQREWLARADAKIQACQEETTIDASYTGESG